MQQYLRMENLINFRNTCISTVTSILLTPIIISFALVICSIRLFVSVYLKISYRYNKLKLIDSMDAFQVYDKPNNTLETYLTLVLEGEAEIERIRKVFTERMTNDSANLYEKFKCKVSKKFGFYCWENMGEEFDIIKHIKLVDHDNHNEMNQNTINKTVWTEMDVLQKLADLYSTPMSIEIPRWELIVIPNYIYEDGPTTVSNRIDTEDKKSDATTEINSKFHAERPNTKYYLLLLRTHHSIMDGISSYLVLNEFADFSVETAIDPLKPLNIPFHLVLLNYINLMISWPKMFWENVRAKPESNCFHGPELTGPKVTAWSKPIPFTNIKTIKQLSKSTTSAVLNAAIGGCFMQLALKKGLPVPERFTVVTSVPMLPYPNIKPQNRFSGAFFSLEVGGNNISRLERIRSSQKTLIGIMKSSLILMNSLLLRFIGILPGFMSQNLTDSRELTCLVSNVPGPLSSSFLFGGDKLIDISGWVPIKNKTGFGICFVSYCGRLRASFVADASIATQCDVNTLAQEFESEIIKMQSELASEVNEV